MKERLLTDTSRMILIILAVFLTTVAMMVFSGTKERRDLVSPIRESTGSVSEDGRFEILIGGETYKMRGGLDSVGNSR